MNFGKTQKSFLYLCVTGVRGDSITEDTYHYVLLFSLHVSVNRETPKGRYSAGIEYVRLI